MRNKKRVENKLNQVAVVGLSPTSTETRASFSEYGSFHRPPNYSSLVPSPFLPCCASESALWKNEWDYFYHKASSSGMFCFRYSGCARTLSYHTQTVEKQYSTVIQVISTLLAERGGQSVVLAFGPPTWALRNAWQSGHSSSGQRLRSEGSRIHVGFRRGRLRLYWAAGRDPRWARLAWCPHCGLGYCVSPHTTGQWHFQKEQCSGKCVLLYGGGKSNARLRRQGIEIAGLD